MAPRSLPDDVLNLICDQVCAAKDFNTLYHCALTGKQLAQPALKEIYRIHESAPIVNGSSEEIETGRKHGTKFANKNAEQEVVVKKWAMMWRSIILSSVEGKTYLPYCRFIRSLNLRDLGNLFEDAKFKGELERKFFAGDLQQFYKRKDSPYGAQQAEKKKNRPNQVLDVVAALTTIGEAVTSKIIVLEELAGHLIPSKLADWVGRAPKLQTLSLWRGGALSAGAEKTIKQACPEFKNLTIFEWTDKDTDEHLSKFLQGLNENTLQSFELISYSDIGVKSFCALCHHLGSLTTLKLSNLKNESIQALPMLGPLTNLRVLRLEDLQGTIQLQTANSDVYQAVTEWLCSCKHLEEINLKKFTDGPAMLTPVLCQDDIKLKKLSVEGYAMRQAREFHVALAQQSSLEGLWLKGDGDDATPDDLTALVDSLCQLHNLRDCYLKDVSDYFSDAHVTKLAENLTELEEFWTSGYPISDAVLKPIAKLKNLKALMFYAMTNFTFDGIKAFVEQMGETNKGLYISIMNADVEANLKDEQQKEIRELMSDKLDGTFEFTLWRDPDVSDFDGGESE